MPRKPQLLTDRFAYHVTARSNNKEWFYLPPTMVWPIMLTQLEEVSVTYAARIQSFVMMSNHLHMLIETPLANLDRIMNYFMREVSRAIGKEAGRINHVFGGRYKSTLICDPIHFAHVYKYIYRNPVRPGLAKQVEEYPYSTLPCLLGLEPYFFPVFDLNSELSGVIPRSWEERLEWLNTPLPKEETDLIRKALRRSEFQFTKERSLRHIVKRMMS